MVASLVKYLEGRRLAATIALLLIIIAGAILVSGDGDVASVRLVIRTTARTSLVLFVLAFTASSAVILWPGRGTRWQRRNRRYLGLSFAASHLVHAIAIGMLVDEAPAVFWTLSNVGSIVTGAIAYLFILAMAATSFDGAVRLLGTRAWRILHGVGVWYLWVSFAVAEGKRVPGSAWYWLPVLLLAAALVLRAAASLASRQARLSAGSAS